jgi:hypothetical protein
MKIFFLAIFMHLSVMGHAQKLRNEFFVFHHIIAGDKTYNSYESQVKLVKASGFDGIESGSEESFDEMFEAIEKTTSNVLLSMLSYRLKINLNC